MVAILDAKKSSRSFAIRMSDYYDLGIMVDRIGP
jgi:hypothetical protein